MIKQTLHFFNKSKRQELLTICKNNLKKNGVLLILSLNTSKNEIPCFSLMKKKLNRGLARDLIMLNSVNKILKSVGCIKENRYAVVKLKNLEDRILNLKESSNELTEEENSICNNLIYHFSEWSDDNPQALIVTDFLDI